MKRILSIKIERILDTDPDTSNLGEYSNTPKEGAIDRKYSQETSAAILLLSHAANRLENSDDENTSIGDAIMILDEAREELSDKNDGDMLCHEYRYFNPSDNYLGEPAEDIAKYTREDYERMEAYNRDEWSYIGIRAVAQVQLQQHGTIQTVKSGALWGIESDSDESYFREVADEQLHELRATLHQMGFSKRAIATAAKDCDYSSL